MIYSEHLKGILSEVRFNVENGDKEKALSFLNMADMYADFHKFEDQRVLPAIQRIAKKLRITEPQAIEAILFYGFYESGRIVAGAGFDILAQTMHQRKLETIQIMMPYLGVNRMSDRDESDEHDRILAAARRG